MRRPLQLVAVAAACSTLLLSGCGTPAGETPPGGVATVEHAAPAPAAGGAGADGGGAAEQDAAAVLGPVCTSPAGYSVARPAGWAVNSGAQLPPCSWFDPAPFTVPEGTDVRTAITLGVETGSVDGVWPDERSRTALEVDGRPAQRIEQVTTAGLYPVGTPVTTYVVDLGNGRVLLADAVGLAAADHERNVRVLDEMMRSLELHGDAPV
jgi:hypothetical protein